ncbi:MAG: ABC transporter permease [Clostridiales bacterium]|nr:ABC transporter permease [Roseburia sp.]MDD7636031.1 ABC transporter permease [Clostridiales bacterium]MDY4113358.1 ABC transporter permease [Roseburia sp.]
MFLHSMKYTFLSLIRDKSQVFWCFAFPLLLGTMFSFAFGGLGEDESFSAIPVAVVMEESADSDATLPISDGIRSLFDGLSEPGENQFLEVTYATEEEARNLLSEKEIYGIIHVTVPDIADYINAKSKDDLPDAPLCLTISAEMNSDPLFQSILGAFVEKFNMEYHAIADIAMTHPEQLPTVLAHMSEQVDYIVEESLGAETLDQSLTYFFNLIAMTCLYAAMSGSNIAIDNQANLSPLGARRSISPAHKLVTTLGDLTALLLFEFITVIVALFYFSGVLGVDFGTRFGYIALTALCGCLAGISLGFFVGSIGRFNKDTKFGILMAVVMISCFLSGLMMGNMRMIVENICPLVNRINPSALISDALYALVIYPSQERFFINIASLLAISAVFCLGGIALVRRKKYASV